MNSNFDVIVVGGGASGMVAAIEAAKKGYNVLIMEANEKLGKKLYATGNGKCNITNEKMDLECFRSGNIQLVKHVLECFDYKDTLDYFRSLGILFKNKNGYYYPLSGQASSVVKALEMECNRRNVEVLLSSPVTAVKHENERYYVYSDDKTYTCNSLILACGSIAGINKKNALKINGYDLAKSLGHNMIPIVSALTGLKCSKTNFYKSVAGVRTDAKVEVMEDDETIARDEGELQLTDYGISGIPVFQVCRFAGYSLRKGKKPQCMIDFLPSIKKEELKNMLLNKKDKYNSLLDCFVGVLNDKLAAGIIEVSGLKPDLSISLCDNSHFDKLVESIKSYRDEIVSPNNFESAQVLAGGMSMDEIDEQMESKYCPGLYMTGEMLDTDGICGGYNLQWAWATGIIAGRSV